MQMSKKCSMNEAGIKKKGSKLLLEKKKSIEKSLTKVQATK